MTVKYWFWSNIKNSGSYYTKANSIDKIHLNDINKMSFKQYSHYDTDKIKELQEMLMSKDIDSQQLAISILNNIK